MYYRQRNVTDSEIHRPWPTTFIYSNNQRIAINSRNAWEFCWKFAYITIQNKIFAFWFHNLHVNLTLRRS